MTPTEVLDLVDALNKRLKKPDWARTATLAKLLVQEGWVTGYPEHHPIVIRLEEGK